MIRVANKETLNALKLKQINKQEVTSTINYPLFTYDLHFDLYYLQKCVTARLQVIRRTSFVQIQKGNNIII